MFQRIGRRWTRRKTRENDDRRCSPRPPPPFLFLPLFLLFHLFKSSICSKAAEQYCSPSLSGATSITLPIWAARNRQPCNRRLTLSFTRADLHGPLKDLRGDPLRAPSDPPRTKNGPGRARHSASSVLSLCGDELPWTIAPRSLLSGAREGRPQGDGDAGGRRGPAPRRRGTPSKYLTGSPRSSEKTS